MADPHAELPGELRAFLFSCIDSAEQVEILMRLSESRRSWTAREVAATLLLAENAVRAHLETLVARGLLRAAVAGETTYRYEPTSGELARCGALLADHYRESRSAVVGFVASNARSGIKKFSDAFKLRDQKE